MRPVIIIAVVLLLEVSRSLSPAATSSRQGDEVVVIAGADTYGYGVIRWRGSECNVITPEHIVKGKIKISVATGGKRSPAHLVTAWDPDIALLKVIDGNICPIPPSNVDTQFMSAEELGNLSKPIEAELHLANEHRGTHIIRVKLHRIEPYHRFADIGADGSAVLQQQMSGGQVYVAKKPVGLLLGIEGVNGRAKVVLHEHLSYLVRPYLKKVKEVTEITLCVAQKIPLEDVGINAFRQLQKRTLVPSFKRVLSERDFRLITMTYVDPQRYFGPKWSEDRRCWEYKVVYKFFAKKGR